MIRSLYRASTQDEAEEKFNAFLHRLPTFVSIAKEVSVNHENPREKKKRIFKMHFHK